SRDEEDALPIRRAYAWFKALTASIDARGALRGQIAAETERLPGAELVGWMAEGPVGTHPLIVIASSREPTETSGHVPALVLTVGLNIDGVPWCGAGLAGLA